VTATVGVDIGGTSIKVARVDTRTGTLLDEPRRAPTPQPARPADVIAMICDLVAVIGGTDAVGVGYPGVVRRGRAATAANLDPAWVGLDVAGAITAASGGRRVTVINDADAAGLAEARAGAALGVHGVVVVVTLGTGIGTAMLHDGALVPNSEFGHLLIDGTDAETLASGRARTEAGMTWERWGARLNQFLLALESLVWPDLFVIGGGISADFDRFAPLLATATPVVAARLGNDAGIIGAALACAAGPPPRERT